MNKLYLLAALFASTFAADTEECGADFSEVEDAGDDDYHYTFTFDMDAATDTYNDDDDDGTTAAVAYSICYQDFVYDFVVDTPTVVPAGVAAEDTVSEFELWAIAADGDDESDVDFSGAEIDDLTII